MRTSAGFFVHAPRHHHITKASLTLRHQDFVNPGRLKWSNFQHNPHALACGVKAPGRANTAITASGCLAINRVGSKAAAIAPTPKIP
jgi:hypothetical protein